MFQNHLNLDFPELTHWEICGKHSVHCTCLLALFISVWSSSDQNVSITNGNAEEAELNEVEKGRCVCELKLLALRLLFGRSEWASSTCTSSLSLSLKPGALMFQHADFGERTGPPVPVPLVLLLQSLSHATGWRTSSGAGAGGATVFKDGDFNLDSHSQGVNDAMLKYNKQCMRNVKTSFNCLMSLVSCDVIFPFF